MRAMGMFLRRKNWNHRRHHQQLRCTRPSDLETTLVSHQIFPTPSLHPPVIQINVYGLVVMGQGEGGILALSWGWCSLN